MSVRLCIVDGDPDALRRNREVLAMFGYGTAGFTRGADAIEWLTAGGADLVVAAMRLPDMTGIELAERLRAARVSAPALLIGVAPTPEAAERAAAAGVVDMLEVPVSCVKLVGAIQKLFGPPGANGRRAARKAAPDSPRGGMLVLKKPDEFPARPASAAEREAGAGRKAETAPVWRKLIGLFML